MDNEDQHKRQQPNRQLDESTTPIQTPNSYQPNLPQQVGNVANSMPITNNNYQHRARNAVLWFLSPFIVLIGAVIVELLGRAINIAPRLFNIFGILAGIVGLSLFIIGPVNGIRTLSKK